MTNLLLSIHRWAARRQGKFYRVLCKVVRLAIMVIDRAPGKVIRDELRRNSTGRR